MLKYNRHQNQNAIPGPVWSIRDPSLRILLLCFAGAIGTCASVLIVPRYSFGDEPPDAVTKTDPSNSVIEVKNSILKSLDTVSVAAGVSGVLASVLVREGDTVALHSPLAKVRDDEATLVVIQAQIALDTAKLKTTRDVDLRLAIKGAEVASKELQRTLVANTRAPDTYPANEVDRMQLLVDKSKLEIERAQLEQRLTILASNQAETELEKAKEMARRHTIYSPQLAMVVAVEKQPGEWVDPNSTVIELMTMSPLRVEGFIDASKASRVRAGINAQVSINIGTTTYEIPGKVTFVSPVANPVNNQVRVFIEVDNENELLRPGLSVKATVGGSK